MRIADTGVPLIHSPQEAKDLCKGMRLSKVLNFGREFGNPELHHKPLKNNVQRALK